MTNSRIGALRPHRRREIDKVSVVIAVVLCVWGFLIAFPFYNAVLISMVPQADYVKTPLLLFPAHFDFSSYEYIFHWHMMLDGLKTTVIVVLLGTVYNVVMTVCAAYALTKPIPGRKLLTGFIVFTMFFQGGLIPLYLQVKNLHLVNTLGSLILPTGMTVMYMLIMQSYFRTIPAEIEESAKLDGANDAVVLFRIVLPLSLPMLATITLFYGVERWNEWYYGMLFIQDASKYPLQLVIRNLLVSTDFLTSGSPELQQYTTQFSLGIQMAAVVVSMLPVMFLYPFLQKYFVKGLTLGSVKS